MKRPPQLTRKKILSYWAENADDYTFNIDVSELIEGHLCWRCTVDTEKRKNKLIRCHIVPLSLGGSNTPENYVLLCSRCHDEMPDTSSIAFFFDWIKEYQECTTVYGLFEVQQGINKAFSKIDVKELEHLIKSFGTDKVNNLIKQIVQKNTTKHWSSYHGSIKKPKNYEYLVYELFNELKRKGQRKNIKKHCPLNEPIKETK